MGFEEAPVEIGWLGGREVNRAGGAIAVFGAEVRAVGFGFVDEGGGGAEPDVEFFDSVVVDEVELNVLVARGLAGGGVGFV